MVAALVIALAACSGGGNDGPSNSGTTSVSSAGPAISGSASATSAPVVTATPLPVVSTKSARAGDTPLTVSLNEVRASDTLMTVTWSVRNDGAEAWTVGPFFWSGLYQKSLADALQSERNGNVDGVYVLDRVSARRYLPARDREGNCVCTSPTVTLTVDPGQTTPLQAVFQAPPATVPTVDVVIPNVGTFADVPVTR